MQQAELLFDAQPTSKAAYLELVDSGKAASQRARILKTMLEQQVGMTRSELSRATGLTINAVCGRVKELLDHGIIRKGRKPRRCMVTGKACEELFCLEFYRS